MKRKTMKSNHDNPPVWKLAPLLLVPMLPLAGCQPQTPEEPTDPPPPPPPGAVEEEQIPPMQPPVSEPESQPEN